MRSLLALLALFVLACPPQKPPGPPPLGGEGCRAACENLARYEESDGKAGCEVSRPTAKGASCYTVCTNALENGAVWNTSCLASAASCAAARSCPEVQP